MANLAPMGGHPRRQRPNRALMEGCSLGHGVFRIGY
jgi:hypothetical protein